MAADDGKPDPAKDDPKPPVKDDDLGDAGKRALAAERQRAKTAEAENADLKKRLDDLEGKDKSEIQKATDRATAAEQRADKAEQRATRLEVAMNKGLTAAQAKRLVGATAEELEADADEILETFGGRKPADDGDKKDPPGGPPTPRPKPDSLGGGSDPTKEPEETDVRKLGARMFPNGN
jgi:hypothetical protein